MSLQSIEDSIRVESHCQSGSRSCILTINCGSSSLKFALFAASARPVAASLRSGSSGSGCPRRGWSWSPLMVLRRRTAQSSPGSDRGHRTANQDTRLRGRPGEHRRCRSSRRPRWQSFLPSQRSSHLRCWRSCAPIVPYDPDHLPGEIGAIEAFLRLDTELPQVACFDTAFHHDLPRVAQIIPIPRRYEKVGRPSLWLSRSVLLLPDRQELGRLAGPGAVRGRVILAHLGSGVEPGRGARRPLHRHHDGPDTHLRAGHGHAVR